MTGLVLKLKPNEKVLINGVILQNCDRAAKIRVRTEEVSILRTRDAIRPEEANTPLRRLYYIAQLALARQAPAEEAQKQLSAGLNQLDGIFTGEAKVKIERAKKGAAEGKFFLVMRSLKAMFDLERTLLSARSPAGTQPVAGAAPTASVA